MTVWLCDKCGAQVTRDSSGAGKYEIQKNCIEHSSAPFGDTRFYKRGLKFCNTCSMEVEKILDDLLSEIPESVTANINKGE